jgi:hypothetical protein
MYDINSTVLLANQAPVQMVYFLRKNCIFTAELAFMYVLFKKSAPLPKQYAMRAYRGNGSEA